jgi:hypothetical protein
MYSQASSFLLGISFQLTSFNRLGYAIGVLWKNPDFAFTCVLTLSLGIGIRLRYFQPDKWRLVN